MASTGRISCTKVPFTPVDDGSIDYVVISYRWGELPETILNTGVDYLCSITSFHLGHFSKLCETIGKESSMRHIKYVWIDAICVNQTNYEQRKATIHYMSKIYERATHILAVPDLHLCYLTKIAIIRQLTGRAYEHGLYIYYLLHGNALTIEQHDLCAFNDVVHHFRELEDPEFISKAIQSWNDYLEERNQWVPKCIQFLRDLICDWATRVWVVSEYHIAKSSKQKLKYWFIQLYNFHLEAGSTFFEFDFTNPTLPPPLEFQLDALPSFAKESKSFTQSMKIASKHYRKFNATMVEYLVDQCFFEMMLKANASKHEDRFYAVLPHFEKYKHRLQSKPPVVNSNIDTIASVRLQLFDWMDTVDKLSLFYLTFRVDETAYTIGLPTFTTAAIAWKSMWFYKTILKQATDPTNRVLWNFDEEVPLTLLRPDSSTQDGLYKLELRPKVFYWNNNRKVNNLIRELGWHDCTCFQQLGLSDPSVVIDLVSIPFYVNTCAKKDDKPVTIGFKLETVSVVFDSDETRVCAELIGSFKENKWILAPYTSKEGLSDDWKLCHCSSDKNSVASNFYIY